MNHNKYIFLDIDDVLATTAQYYSKKRHEEWNCYAFDKKCVSVLNDILKKTNAIIILSSDWKFHYNLETLNRIFEWNEIIKPIQNTTGSFWGVKYHKLKDLEICRADEIKDYVMQHELQNNKWVAIDDLDMKKYLGDDHFVHTPRPNEGIKQSGVKDKILKRLL